MFLSFCKWGGIGSESHNFWSYVKIKGTSYRNSTFINIKAKEEIYESVLIHLPVCWCVAVEIHTIFVLDMKSELQMQNFKVWHKCIGKRINWFFGFVTHTHRIILLPHFQDWLNDPFVYLSLCRVHILTPTLRRRRPYNHKPINLLS